MKIWIDCLTPKQLLFYQILIDKIGKKHKILFTSRVYGEVSGLIKIHGYKPIIVGKFGGGSRSGKLEAAIDRMGRMLKIVRQFAPDIAVSSTSPDAARIAFGLGIRHVAFSDAPHEVAIMKLTLPLTWRLLTPMAIPKEEFSKYGIDKKKIVRYNALDGAVTMKRDTGKNKPLPFQSGKKNIVIRVEEEEASYGSRSKKTIPIIRQIVTDHADHNIMILARYAPQAKNLKRLFGKKARIVTMSYDGRHLLENTDVFVGSGGTMTVESALMGVPTISYRPIPNVIDDYLVRKRLARRGTSPKNISGHIRQILRSSGDADKRRAERIVSKMEDPFDVFLRVIKDSK
ncbi:MAG: DUF354 domain-containing protein [Nitrosopumilus sp. B06]|nr:MAG: DUF354 domain-containing protein [Nitrosopumilus sp. D6]RNJ80295.1 MAG: DUF354 domain-containing protein [Nitrosopumilus sp. B06]